MAQVRAFESSSPRTLDARCYKMYPAVHRAARMKRIMMCKSQLRPETTNNKLAAVAWAGLTAAFVFYNTSSVSASTYSEVEFGVPLADQSKILSSTRREAIGNQLLALERDTGYRVRVLTKERYTSSQMDRNRAIWQVDKNTIVLVFDPSAPNVFGYEYLGDNVLLGPLKRPFWIELQARFGNMFYVRDNGEASAVQAVVDTVDGCLRQGGCVRVPGLPEEQYYFTLVLAIIAGIICGFSFRLEPNEVVSKRWFWPVLLSPLWGSVFVNFGLGPVLSRTDELQPVIKNCAAFLIAAYLFKPNPIFFKEPDSR